MGLAALLALVSPACSSDSPAGSDGGADGAGEGDAPFVTGDDGGAFACGLAAICDGRSEVCEHVAGGAPPGVDSYDCTPIPAECDHDVSCTCLTNALRARGAVACTAAGSDLTVQIAVP
jgi:hypothetical protein